MKTRFRETFTIDYWPGFTDAMLSAMLVLIFVVMIFIITQTGLVQALSSKEVAIAKLSTRIDQLTQQLSLTEAQASVLSEDLSQTREDLGMLFQRSVKEAKRLAESNELTKTQQKELSALNVSMDKFSNQVNLLSGQLDTTRAQHFQEKARLAETLDTLRATTTTLAQKDRELGTTRQELEALSDYAQSQSDDLAARSKQIDDLTKAVTAYMDQIAALNQHLSAAKMDVNSKDASLTQLSAAIEKFTEQIKMLSDQLAGARKRADAEELEVAKLLDEIESRDEQIAKLRDFEKYRSEFLARLADVFAGAENIRVSGDRFVFQGEVLFPPGGVALSEPGKLQLRKFAKTYLSLEAKIPRDMPVNIQIQGHTDTDPVVFSDFPSNWELSTARATSVVRFLTLCGVPQNRLSAAGFSHYYPAVADDSYQAKRQNRRIEILITRR